jgi:hypothetical protein
MRTWGVIIMLFSGLLLSSIIIAGNVSAGAEDPAILDHDVSIEVAIPDPPEDNELIITATFSIYGGCCYSLYANNVYPEWDFPEEIEVIDGPTPKGYVEIEGTPGGEPVENTFNWTVRCKEPGIYTLNITVNTSDSGSANGVYDLRNPSYAAISSPILTPSTPGEHKPLYFEFTAEPSYQRDITDLALYYVVLDEDVSNVWVDDDTLVVTTEDSLYKNVKGSRLEILPSEGPEDHNYNAEIELLEGGGHIYYWVQVTESDGETVTSPVYTEEIQEEEGPFPWASVILSGVVILIGVGVIIGKFIHSKYTKK